ncbi:MAG: L-serine ammonia-lyase, iron-sulfur-dependent, subunit alpha [Bacteroidales bacterium]|nr:L-serine ammonia-lyase, iron-sulfur-dependent, subunit alpha [Bacteroidales bacterium]
MGTNLKEKLIKAGVHNADKLMQLMPAIYFESTDLDDFLHHENFLNRFFNNDKLPCNFYYKGDIEDFIFVEYNTAKLRDRIAGITKDLHANELLYRLFPNQKEGFILAAVYRDILLGARANEFPPPSYDDYKNSFFDEDGKMTTHLISSYDKSQKCYTIHSINVAHQTMLGNLIDTLEMHNLNPDMIEVWRLRHLNTKINSFYKISIYLTDDIEQEEVNSLNADFYRYMQHYTEPMSIFDLVGPSMLGPSSSHTAGANRIGQIAGNIIKALMEQGEKFKSISIKLLSSFRDTGVGHKTPSALGGGLWGFATDDEAMIDHGDPDFLKQNGIVINNKKIEFNGFIKGSPADDLKYLSDKNSNIAEVIAKTDKKEYVITGFSIGGGNVEVRYFNGRLDKPITGKTEFYLYDEKITDKLPTGKNYSTINSIYADVTEASDYIMPFNTFEEMIDFSQQRKRSIVDIALMVETGKQKTTPDKVREQMQEYWDIMRNSVIKGVNSDELSMLKLSGDDAIKTKKYAMSNSLYDNIYGRAVAYATAVNEINAKSGQIIACPTAGSCGIVPGVLMAYTEMSKKDDETIIDSLIVAGFLGMLLFNDVTTAGADYGCQAEVGSASAMAASALCYAEGGDTEQVANAFILAIKNSLGLICDPIAGLVEVPCVKRNGIYSSVAISAALMALAGVKSYVSPDEVILTMREVGERINTDYKETARAGLAKTRDGKHVERMFESEVRKFFE